MNQRSQYCLSCHSKLIGPYCAQCGEQADREIPRVRDLIKDLIGSLTNADSRLWRTLWLLLVKPGQVAKQYLAGRRALFLPPMRLYLIISVVFFLILQIDEDITDDRGEPLVAVTIDGTSPNTPAPAGGCEDLSYQGVFADAIHPRLQAACRQAIEDKGAVFSKRFMNNVPKAMFILMPLFSATMLLVYWRPRRLFAEHLTFQLFTHCGLFLIASLLYLIDWALPPSWDAINALMLVSSGTAYGLISLKTYYQQSLVLTLAKFFSLGLIYLFLFAILMVATALAAIW